MRAAENLSKAGMLRSLEGVISHAVVLPQVSLGYKTWKDGEHESFISEAIDFLGVPLIVRSSAANEDSLHCSMAGHYLSIQGVTSHSGLSEAVSRVFKSYENPTEEDAIFVQPLLTDVEYAGVLFSRDPSTGAPYFVINFSEGNCTDAVTAGIENSRLMYVNRSMSVDLSGFETWITDVILLARELEDTLSTDSLDIEFAIDSQGQLYLLQVRPLVVMTTKVDIDTVECALGSIASKFHSVQKYIPNLKGHTTIWANMPDWNPAEIIGVRPYPLAMSLYRELITDNIWAYQRHNYGYRNLRSFPLMVDVFGQPYIDVRVSFNSFIPASLDDSLSDKLVNHYLDTLFQCPEKHDKVEFDIVFSCYSFDFDEKTKTLTNLGFSGEEIDHLKSGLLTLTNRIISSEGLWRKDLEKIKSLEQKIAAISASGMTEVEKIYWLLEDCKRYGTLPFAGLARAAFVAVQILRSMVEKDIISQPEYDSFMETICTVSGDALHEKIDLKEHDFLKKYGHLRPGTYEITSDRYDAAPAKYFAEWSCSKPLKQKASKKKFQLNASAALRLEQAIKVNGIEQDAHGLIDCARHVIQGREFAKFIFTKSLSDALELIAEFGRKLGFSRYDMSFCNIDAFKELYCSVSDPLAVIGESIRKGKAKRSITESIILPPVIATPKDVYAFELPQGYPNYITSKSVTAQTTTTLNSGNDLEGKIVFIESADPGFDWIFQYGIGGLVTQYGGANSHMAVRANELSIPAVIGAGKILFDRWSAAKLITIDAANKNVLIIR